VRFFLDQDVYAITAQALREAGHDVATAAQLGLSRAPDVVLLNRAGADRRILVTRDKDYGGLVFVERLGRGVILLRISPSTIVSVHNELMRVLGIHAEDDFVSALVVVEPGVHRFRKVI
jgi:predicted nuclease of predicted toxin-antitoxin system